MPFRASDSCDRYFCTDQASHEVTSLALDVVVAESRASIWFGWWADSDLGIIFLLRVLAKMSRLFTAKKPIGRSLEKFNFRWLVGCFVFRSALALASSLVFRFELDRGRHSFVTR